MPSGMVGAGAPAWEILRKWNAERMAKNREQLPRGGWQAQAQALRAKKAGIPYSPDYKGDHDRRRSQYFMDKRPEISPMDTLNAQQNQAFPVQPPAMPAGPSSSVAATGPGAAPSPMGPPSDMAGPGEDVYSSPIDELSPEMLSQIMQGEALQEQLQYAQGLRDKEMPGGRYTSGGRQYTASHPIEHISTAYGKYRGSKGVKNTQDKQQKIRTSILDLLRNKGKIGTPPILPDDTVVGGGFGGGYKGVV